ncbi:radical SAM protein, partial [Enterococcus hirae]
MSQTETNRRLMTALQSRGLRLLDESAGAPSRRGGAGPSDHKAVQINGQTIMVPVH